MAFLFILPALINFIVFKYIPIISAAWVSLWHYSLLGGFRGFAGLENYAAMLEDPTFWNALRVTAIFTLVKVPTLVVFALGLALLMQGEAWIVKIVRASIYSPVVTSMIVVSIVWGMMYHSQIGLINSILRSLGFQAVAFLSDPGRALPAVIVVTLWRDVGFSMIILMAGLKGIPETFYEAAAIDGASHWQSFLHITLPLLRRVILFVVVTQTIFAFQVFTPIFALTKGGPQDATKVIVYYIYQHAFLFQDMAYASAMSMVVLVIILVVSLIQMRLLRSEVEY
jgi:ABC-type sugar transport system permease subunit